MGQVRPPTPTASRSAMPAPALLLAVLDSFRPEFSPRTWARVVTLVLGTITAGGRRTVAAALRQMGLHDDPNFSSYHQVFNRAAWSPRRLARRLLSAVIAAFVPKGVGLSFAIDETPERRWGRKIRIRGHYRDPLASSKERSVSASGIRWIVLALVVDVPWASRPWALPILSLPAPTPEVSQKLGRRHKTIAERARQMIACSPRCASPPRPPRPPRRRCPASPAGPGSPPTACPTSRSSWPTRRPPGPG